MNAGLIEVVLNWTAVGLYLAAAVAVTAGVLFGRERWAERGLFIAAAGLVPHGAALILRWIAAGHGPYMMRYEVLSSDAWVAVAVLLVFLRFRPRWTPAAMVAIPVAVLMLALAQFANPEIRALPPTLRSVWLVFHVLMAKLAAGAFLVSLALAVLVLRKAAGRGGRLTHRTPPIEVLDATLVRVVGFGFIFWTVNIAAGAIWANQSWGRYWGWDPIETWSLITWLVYGTLLHLRRFFRLKPLPTARLAVGAFALFVLTLLILPFVMPSLHSAYFQ